MSDSANEIIERLRNQVKQLERELNEANGNLRNWVLAAFNCGLYRADVPHNTPQLWQMAQVDATARLLTDRNQWKAMAQEFGCAFHNYPNVPSHQKCLDTLSRFNALNKP